LPNSLANQENVFRKPGAGSRKPEAEKTGKGYGLGLTWAGTEARPTKKGFFPETRNRKPKTFSKLYFLAHRKPITNN
jgi:hypothetical protein